MADHARNDGARRILRNATLHSVEYLFREFLMLTALAKITAPAIAEYIWMASPCADRRERQGKCIADF